MTPGIGPGLQAYRLLTALLTPLRGRFLRRRLAAGKEDADRLGERSGAASLARPDGPLIWLHGASVGELLSLLPLVAPLQARGLAVLVTSGTVTSAQIAAERLPANALHQFVPLDFPDAAERFLDHWRPDLVLFAESEIWPNLMLGALRRTVPLGLVNARMSERSTRRWMRFGAPIRPILSRLSLCLAQSEEDANRFRQLGAKTARAVGNLKLDQPALPADEPELARVRVAIGTRPLWLAASTHEGEEAIVGAAHRQLSTEMPDLLTVIAPRHPARADGIAALLITLGLRVARRSRGEPVGDADVYLADTLGELGLLYRLAPVALIGGSLCAPGGGHNPVEAARLGAALLSGPMTQNFVDLFAALDTAGACRRVRNADEIASALSELLENAPSRDAMRAAAEAVLARSTGALAATLAALDSTLGKLR